RERIDADELCFAIEAAEFAALPEFTEDVHADSAVSVLRDQCRMTAGAAAEAIRVGEQLDRLPESAEALLGGEIGFRHLGVLASTACALSESETLRGFSEQPLLAKARELSVRGLIRAALAYRHLKDPEAYVAQECQGVEHRMLELKTDDSGSLWLRGWLDNEGGAIVRSALEPLAKPAGDSDERRLGRRYADALVELAGAGARAQVQVSATVETLAQLAGCPAAELDLGAPLSAAALQRLTCDCSLTRVLLDSDSAVIEVGRARRTVSPAQRAALLKRDRGCRFPNCERPGRYCEGHHLRHWARGGETDLDNLVLLCRRHHHLVHEGGWDLKGDRQGGFIAVPPRPAWLSDLPAA
ncbi:MAG TPA: DUF222 domain-containing protein, partial [Candidatus Dormibacteraeota bacterium]